MYLICLIYSNQHNMTDIAIIGCNVSHHLVGFFLFRDLLERRESRDLLVLLDSR